MLPGIIVFPWNVNGPYKKLTDTTEWERKGCILTDSDVTALVLIYEVKATGASIRHAVGL